ncbi:MAG: hypothetical protein ACM3UY_06395 [Methanocella sp.]
MRKRISKNLTIHLEEFKVHNPKKWSLIVFITVSIVILLLLSLAIYYPIEPPKAKVFLLFILSIIWGGITLYLYLRQKAAELYPTKTPTQKE